jgi:hypothetical protein
MAGAANAILASPGLLAQYFKHSWGLLLFYTVEMFKVRMQGQYGAASDKRLRVVVSEMWRDWGFRRGIMRGYWVYFFMTHSLRIWTSSPDYSGERNPGLCRVSGSADHTWRFHPSYPQDFTQVIAHMLLHSVMILSDNHQAMKPRNVIFQRDMDQIHPFTYSWLVAQLAV